ncbi:hypothetical protein DM860_006989 [Cuscuta australis]|uniref:Uncharacterized protein n=1 Tax=Cuscuta australis TaxID=267555 RepID=A0A328E5Y2_9ASTE|nr:hypothetical protein DM860_006989 [Cuscuta australis]
MRAVMAEEISSRIRLVFHGGILSESQVSEGLENTWVLLKPQHQRTISDLGSYILQIFNLHESCPCGVLLSMDGFALPPFESSSILKDKDVISVKRRIGTPAIECNDAPLKSRPLLLANEEFNKEIRGYENKEPKGNEKAKVHVKFHLEDKLGEDATLKKKKANGKRKSGTLAIEFNEESSKSESFLLANQVFNNETGGYESEEPAENGKNQGCDTSPLKVKLGEGATSKKRKTLEKLSKKKKKHRSEIMEPDIDDEAEHAEEVPLVLKREKSIHKSRKKSVLNEKDCAETSEVNVTEPVTNMGKSVHSEQQISDSKKKDDAGKSTADVTAPVTIMNDNMKETEKDNVDTTPKSEETPKRRSRNAKRKAAKRQWLREMAKIQKANADPQSEAVRNWKEMQSKPVREESAGQPNGHKSSAGTEAEALKYWKAMQSKSAREIAARRPNGHKINLDSRSEALRNWKEMQSKVGTEGTTVQPNGNPNTKWGQASVMSEEGLNKPNGPQNWKQEQSRVNSGESVSLQKVHRNWTHGQIEVKNGEDVRVGNGESTYERGEASDQVNGLLHLNELHADDTVKDAEEHIPSDARNNSCDKPNENGDSDSDDETVVPVEIRPGHIRFEPLGKERTPEQTQLKAMKNYHWNGITSKKKGQKWGTEKSSFFQRIEVNNDSNREQSEMPDAEMHNAEMLKQSAEPFDFTKVPFLSGSPKEGDVIAYRLLELSSTWTPELSSYRVGEVSSYDSQSGVVSLMPVPKFPIPCKKPDGDDESSMQPDDSVYKEDGSLEIVFSLLAEVRILEHKTRVPGSSCDDSVAGDDSTLFTTTANVQTPASIPPETQDLIHGSEKMHSTVKENDANPWDQFSEAITAKKLQLSQENSGKPLSYKSLRGTAMGPTLAFLRSIKHI